MKITEELIRKIRKSFLSLDEFAYLYSLYLQADWGIELPMENLNKLKTLGYMSKTSIPLITNQTYELMEENDIEENTFQDEFDNFWKLYPATDMWGRFPHTRNIKTNKPECFDEYKRLRREYDSKIIDGGLKAYISFLKSTSTSANSIKYMKGPLNFLKDKLFTDYTESKTDIPYGEELA